MITARTSASQLHRNASDASAGPPNQQVRTGPNPGMPQADEGGDADEGEGRGIHQVDRGWRDPEVFRLGDDELGCSR